MLAGMTVNRLDYEGPELHKETIAPTPLHQTLRWFKDAVRRQEDYGDIIEPGALSVATCGADGMPSQRVVLMRFFDELGPGFVSHLGSRKANDLEANPKISASLTWLPLFRAIHFRGTVERIADELVDEYWHSRPYQSQISAVASEQSRPVASRAELEARFAAAREQYPDGSIIPRPEGFVGYRVRPTEVEFWSGRTNRFHDRLLFSQPGHLTLGDPGWRVTRLMP